MEEPRAFHPPNVSPRMLRPAAHPPQQNAMMVDIHDQVRVSGYKQTNVTDFFFPNLKIPLHPKLVGYESHIITKFCLPS